MAHTAPDRPISSDRNIAIVFRRGDHLADNHRLGATHPADRWIRLGTIFQSRTGLKSPAILCCCGKAEQIGVFRELLRTGIERHGSPVSPQAVRWLILLLWYVARTNDNKLELLWSGLLLNLRSHGTRLSPSLAECLLGGVSGREIRVLPPNRRAGAHDGRISL